MANNLPGRETFDWLKPSPLWDFGSADAGNGDLFRPRLLKFESDDFMDEFMAAAADAAPKPLADRVTPAPADAKSLLRLYQPMHGSYYLVCASLCCRQPGFPDREIRGGDGEQAFFVLRKRINGAEFGWVVQGRSKRWQQVTNADKAVLPGEERLPLIAAAAGNGRSLLFGYVPVASRETYAAAPAEFLDADAAKADAGRDPRIQELGSRFTSAFIPALRAANGTWKGLSPLESAPNATAAQLLTISVYLLLDLWEFFQEHLPAVAQALVEDPTRSPPGAQHSLMEFLRKQKLNGTLTLAEALHQVAIHRDALNAPGGADVSKMPFSANYDLNQFVVEERKKSTTGPDAPYATLKAFADGLNTAVATSLPPAQAGRASFDLPKVSAGDEYALRLVYERPQCVPPRVYVSRRTEPFELAGVYDPDAPARPIRIPLPGDVSLAGLRKFKKNVSFMMSDAMRKKMGSLTGCEQEMLDGNGPCPEPGGDFAFICSFSIQIIFIVAFMLLLIFVIVFNIIFFWIFFFKICFPIPKKLAPK
jgi:hypothetical protein